MKLHLVADTVPRGTTFCQNVPDKVDKKKQKRVSGIILWTTHWILHYTATLYSTAIVLLHCTAATTTFHCTALHPALYHTIQELVHSIAATTAVHYTALAPCC